MPFTQAGATQSLAVPNLVFASPYTPPLDLATSTQKGLPQMQSAEFWLAPLK